MEDEMTHTEYKTALGKGSRLLRAVLKETPGTTAYKAAQERYAAWFEASNRTMVVQVMKAAGCKEAEFA